MNHVFSICTRPKQALDNAQIHAAMRVCTTALVTLSQSPNYITA